ncbi:hypothetical protein TNIN_247621 [Trichonephila inaurata madagascariensis]|uniref:Uncharacterized protein n=1 Tax=Trichonephila inaurata madagascariensis TaxID=2747483 RepID=A0A8X6Y0G9_9ARAC|nr:hypothetical protein TNIN_247621 [Trichonephila inaurata madagascariensis]
MKRKEVEDQTGINDSYCDDGASKITFLRGSSSGIAAAAMFHGWGKVAASASHWTRAPKDRQRGDIALGAIPFSLAPTLRGPILYGRPYR